MCVRVVKESRLDRTKKIALSTKLIDLLTHS